MHSSAALLLGDAFNVANDAELRMYIAELLSQRSSPIVSRASSPTLSTFGSGNIASGIARGSSLQSRHSSPVRLGSGSALSSGGEGGSGQPHLPRSPPLSFAGSLPRQSSVTPLLGPHPPTALEELSGAQALQVSCLIIACPPHLQARGPCPESLRF